ncbi:hypothetical protein AAC387_Pa05g0097 [Persea americana]
MAMMSTGYTEDPARVPSCLTLDPSGPGRHHGHDVDWGHCRMSTWEVNIQFTRLTSQGMMSTGKAVNNKIFQTSVTLMFDHLCGPLTIQIGFHHVCQARINGMAQP